MNDVSNVNSAQLDAPQVDSEDSVQEAVYLELLRGVLGKLGDHDLAVLSFGLAESDPMFETVVQQLQLRFLVKAPTGPSIH